jgi:hypothetical protein
MSLHTKDLNIIRKAGIETLTKELGPVETAYFIRQFDMGKGDYTKERDELLEITRLPMTGTIKNRCSTKSIPEA